MSAGRLIVVGAGRRVQEDVLPVVHSLPQLQLLALAARSSRTLETDRGPVSVTALDEVLGSGLLSEADLVYLVVGKPAVPGVLARLLAAGTPRYRLVLETPGLLLKHLGHLSLVAAFPDVSMAEDMVALPWVELVRRAAAEGPLGPLREVVLDRSAYRYHGVALLKALFAQPVRSGRRRAVSGGGALVKLRFAGGGRGVLIEPRDYAEGHITITGAGGVASDAPDRVQGAHALELLSDGAGGVRLTLAGLEDRLGRAEAGLLGPVLPGERVTARMHGLKRVGLRRLLAALADGRDGYPLAEGLDDMAVDAVLEKTGRWLGTPLTSLTSPFARALAGTLLRPLARRSGKS